MLIINFEGDGEDSSMKMDRTTENSPLHSDSSKDSPAVTATTSAPAEMSIKESPIELENKLLKHEIQSLNQEMSSVIIRAKTAQEGKSLLFKVP